MQIEPRKLFREFKPPSAFSKEKTQEKQSLKAIMANDVHTVTTVTVYTQ